MVTETAVESWTGIFFCLPSQVLICHLITGLFSVSTKTPIYREVGL